MLSYFWLLSTIEDLEFVYSLCDANRAARDTVATSVAFSSVSGTEANRLLEELQLTEVDGFAAAPIEIPAGQRIHCIPFNILLA